MGYYFNKNGNYYRANMNGTYFEEASTPDSAYEVSMMYDADYYPTPTNYCDSGYQIHSNYNGRALANISLVRSSQNDYYPNETTTIALSNKNLNSYQVIVVWSLTGIVAATGGSYTDRGGFYVDAFSSNTARIGIQLTSSRGLSSFTLKAVVIPNTSLTKRNSIGRQFDISTKGNVTESDFNGDEWDYEETTTTTTA